MNNAKKIVFDLFRELLAGNSIISQSKYKDIKGFLINKHDRASIMLILFPFL